MSKLKVKSNKWYGKIWPAERRKIKILQALIDYKEDEIIENAHKFIEAQLIYGFTEDEAEKWIKENAAL